MKLDRLTIRAKSQPPGLVLPPNVQRPAGPNESRSEAVNLAAYDFDATAFAAILDPAKADDDHTYRFYRKLETGAYDISFNQGPRVHLDGITIDDIGMRPSKLQIAKLMAMMPATGAAMSPEHAREMVGNAATVYEGIRIGDAEVRGISIDTPEGAHTVSTIRLNIDNGKIGQFAIEGLDVPNPKGQLKIGRFAVKSFDIANFLRLSAMFSNPTQKPSPDQIAGLLALLDGIELTDVSAPFRQTGKAVKLDNFALDWGQFIGPIPSRLHLTGKMVTPIDPSDPTAKPLVGMGLQTLAVDCDVSAAWTEASRSFVLEAPTLDVDGVFKTSAHISFDNVARQIFTLDPQQAGATAAQIEAGALEVTVRDLGGVDLLVKQTARLQNVGSDVARKAIVDGIRSRSATAMADHPDAVAAAEALANFIQTPGQTLTIKLTPLGRVPALQLLQTLKTDPLIALAQFKIEASTGL